MTANALNLVAWPEWVCLTQAYSPKPEKKGNDFRVLDGQGEETDLHRLDLHVFDQVTQIGDGPWPCPVLPLRPLVPDLPPAALASYTTPYFLGQEATTFSLICIVFHVFLAGKTSMALILLKLLKSIMWVNIHFIPRLV